jgi:hypothetical protein
LAISLAATITPPERKILSKIFCHSMGRCERRGFVVVTPIPGVGNHSFFMK